MLGLRIGSPNGMSTVDDNHLHHDHTFPMTDVSSSPSQMAILAYGSLLSEPGEELAGLLGEQIDDMETPFPIELARACSCRDRAPTLAPVERGGASVRGALLLASPSASESALIDALWRRETRTERRDEETSPDGKDLLIRRAQSLEEAHGLKRVFYAHLKANIDDRRPEHLAEMAIESARAEAGQRREDGIAYLIDLKAEGISTPLLPAYENEILRRVEVNTLEAAREQLVQTEVA